MSTFTDTLGRQWSVALTIADAKRVRDRLGVNLLQVLDKPDLLTELAADPITFVDVLYVLVEPQTREKSVSDVEFGEALSGSAIDSATTAFLEALVDFFPGARNATLRRIVERANMEAQGIENALTQSLDSGEIDLALDRAMNSTKSTGLLAPPKSNPTT